MERTRVLRPGSSLLSPNGPSYYSPVDLYVGGKIEVLSHHFVLLDADEYVFSYMESDQAKFKQSNGHLVLEKVARLLASPTGKEAQVAIKEQLIASDKTGSGVVERRVLVDIVRSAWKQSLTDHVCSLRHSLRLGTHYTCATV